MGLRFYNGRTGTGTVGTYLFCCTVPVPNLPTTFYSRIRMNPHAPAYCTLKKIYNIAAGNQQIRPEEHCRRGSPKLAAASVGVWLPRCFARKWAAPGAGHEANVGGEEAGACAGTGGSALQDPGSDCPPQHAHQVRSFSLMFFSLLKSDPDLFSPDPENFHRIRIRILL